VIGEQLVDPGLGEERGVETLWATSPSIPGTALSACVIIIVML
jgi:hypothetical protein